MFNLLPRDPKLYDELEQLSSLVVNSAQHLESLVNQFPNFNGHVDALSP